VQQSDGFPRTQQLDFEAWGACLRSSCGGQAEAIEPNTFAGWVRPVSVSGLPAVALKIQCGLAATDPGHHAYRSERTQRNVRLAGGDWYQAVFQVAGRLATTQNDQAVQLAAGDVALFDAARPWTCSTSNAEWLALRLPRQSLVSHLGFEPEGGLSRPGATLAARLLFDVVRDAAEGDGSPSSPADAYMQMTVYYLFGALFAPSDPRPVSRHRDKLFTRIRGIVKDRFDDPDFGPRKLAAETGISVRYVQKLFTERGSTFSQFIYSLRLDHAARLLHRRALLGICQPLSEIAYACGFNDYTHFARKFRHRFGFSPGTHPGGHGRAGDGTVGAGTGEGASWAHEF
jgi:AraC family transcriptional activator of tynA and feaB